jgi:hypothetical protein
MRHVEPLSTEELFAHLLAHKLRLEQNQPTLDLFVGYANLASQGRQNVEDENAIEAITPLVMEILTSTL